MTQTNELALARPEGGSENEATTAQAIYTRHRSYDPLKPELATESDLISWRQIPGKLSVEVFRSPDRTSWLTQTELDRAIAAIIEEGRVPFASARGHFVVTEPKPGDFGWFQKRPGQSRVRYQYSGTDNEWHVCPKPRHSRFEDEPDIEHVVSVRPPAELAAAHVACPGCEGGGD